MSKATQPHTPYLSVAAALLSVPTVLSSVYLGLLGALSRIAGTQRCHAASEQATSVLALVPAHDEAAGIAECIDRIRASDLSGSVSRIVVIADNCLDETAAVARSVGADVVERNEPTDRGKGEALAWSLEQPGILDNIDFVLFLDADDHPGADAALVAVAHARHTGSDIVQLPHLSGEGPATERAAVDELATTLINRVRGRGLRSLGLPPRLQGGGMLIRSEVLRVHGWPSGGVSEDFFATLAFIDHGCTIEFCDGEIIRAESATRSSARMSQRVRWESGRVRALSRLLPLIRDTVGQPSRARASMVAYIVVPPFTMHMGFIGFTALLGLARRRFPALGLLGFAMSTLYVAEGLRLMRPERRRLALRAAPRFVLWKYRVFARAIRRSAQREWVRTPRE